MSSVKYCRVVGDLPLNLQPVWIAHQEPKMKRQRQEPKSFIDAMKTLRMLRDQYMTEEHQNLLKVIKCMLIRQNDEIHDLKTALSKSDRKCNALNDMIQCVAEKNGGLRHRISRLQSMIGKMKVIPPPDTEELQVAISQIEVWLNSYFNTHEGYEEASWVDGNWRDIWDIIKHRLSPAMIEPLTLETLEIEPAGDSDTAGDDPDNVGY